jgi:hypothetical protein
MTKSEVRRLGYEVAELRVLAEGRGFKVCQNSYSMDKKLILRACLFVRGEDELLRLFWSRILTQEEFDQV